MITDLANLGGSLRGTTDLGGAKAKDIGKGVNAQSGRPEKANSFDQILQNKVSPKPTENVVKSDKDAKAYQLRKDPMPVQKNMDDMKPEAPESADRTSLSSSKNEPRTAQKEIKSWEEPGSVKEKRISEKSEKKSESSSPNREQVMLQFMDSMESEFGIPPERIAEAMTQISESDQLSSPEDSASQVIAQLDLPKDQEERALALYAGMLAQLKQTQEPAPIKAMLGGTAATVTAPVLMSSHQRRTALNNSLEQMNNKFFMQGPMAMKPEATATKNMMAQMAPEVEAEDVMPDQISDDAFPKDQMSFGKQMPNEKLPPFAQNQEGLKPAPSFQPQKSYGANVKALQEQLQNSKIDPNSAEGKQLAKALTALSASAAALDEGLKMDPKNMQALKAEQAMGLSADQAVAASAASAMGMAGMDMGSEEGDDSDDMGQGSSSGQQFGINQPNAHLSQHQRSEATGAAGQSFGAMMAGAESRQASESQKQANIQQLMNQAEYMIKKGGGEAKIQMAPEGIGQVHMKMTVLDGKVSLEMQAETKEAKKLLESSMNDLRSSLGQHQLTVDHVKVDVGNQLASDNSRSDAQNQQRQMDMNQHQQSKNQAREFWSQFGDGGGFDRRGTFFENPAIRAYGGTSRTAALTPTSPGAVAEKRYAGSGKGRGLNLVA